MDLVLLVHLLQKLDILRRQITKLIDDCFLHLRRLHPKWFLDNLFLSCNGRDAVHKHDQVYL